MGKKIISIILAVLLAVSVAYPAGAVRVSCDEAVETLETLGLVLGGDNGFDGGRAPTRYEAVIMLVRLLGKENQAKNGTYAAPFDDLASWAAGYVAYAYQNDLTTGTGGNKFSGTATAGARDCVTFVLRALGYDDSEGDFTWQESIAFADSIGLTHGEYSADSNFLRNDLACLCYSALGQEVKDTGEKLVEKLYREGVLSYSDLVRTRLASYVNTGKRTYDPEEIYALASSSVFFLEVYETEEDYRNGEVSATSSGFFITSAGEAVVSYHAIDGARYGRITTTDGKIYNLDKVVFYDYYRDIAVVRISRTATDGNAVARFPYLDIGDSDAVSNGSPIYTISNPIGLQDSFSAGYISNKLRVLNDADYPCIQISAPVSAGSSGGPVLNKHGEVIGVIYGAYTTGQNLNLCVPINCIESVSRTAAGESLAGVCEKLNGLKEKAVITATETDIVLQKGETATITIESDYPGSFSLKYIIGDPSVAEGEWGAFNTSRTVPVKITGKETGETQVVISFHDISVENDASVIINVKVQ